MDTHAHFDEAPELAEGSGPLFARRHSDASEEDGATGEPLLLSLEVTDPEVIAELSRRRPGRDRERYAAAALRVGVLALRTAGGAVDADAVKRAGSQMMAELRETLAQRSAELTGEMARALTQYFDPDRGVLSQKLDSLVKDGGQLERVLRAHVGDGSVLAHTLAESVGKDSDLFRMLSPDEAAGLKAQIEKALASALDAQNQQVLRQFSLDDKSSALSRLIGEIKGAQGELTRDIKGQVDAVAREFSLDHPDSALSRLVKNLTLDDEESSLARLKRELVLVVDQLSKRNQEFHADVRETLAALDARKKEEARSTRHGVTFEEALGQLLATEAQRLGDIHQATGATTGIIKHCKVGDYVLTMGPDSAAPGAAIVFEAKEDKSYDLKEALAEIDRGRKNRQAQMGVFVFSAQACPAGLEALTRYGSDIVCIWDPEDPASDLIVRCAYNLARGLAVREADDTEHSADVARAVDLAVRAVEKQIKYLDEVQTMAKTVENSGQKIRQRMDRMRAELASQVDAIDQQVRALRAVTG